MNLRPLGPQPSALPDCATPRGWMHCAASGRFRLSWIRIGTAGSQLLRHTNVRSPGYVCRMRQCGRCNREKPVDEFAWRRKTKGQRDSYCRPCRAAYKQEHYATNRQQYIDAAQRRRRAIVFKRVRYLVEYLRDHPCVDCGETDPVVLEFDHLRDKEFGIGKGLRDREWRSVLDEMAKCEVICANCHRRRTARRGGFLRAVVAQR